MFHDGDRTADTTPDRDASSGDPADEPPATGGAATWRMPAASVPSAAPDAAEPAVLVEAEPGLPVADAGRLATAVAAHLERAVAELAVPVDRLAVRLLGDASMAVLHRRHCGIEGPTDVLSFPAAAVGEPVDADIACGVEVAAREAAARGHRLEEELLLYALHGLLHCLGHDDHDPEAFAVMHAEEDRVLAAIGVAARFASPARDATPPTDVAGGPGDLESPGACS